MPRLHHKLEAPSHPFNPRSNVRSSFRRMILTAVFLLSLLPLAAHAEVPILTLTNGDEKITNHAIGDHLYVALSKAEASTLYTVRLLDEADTEVASAVLAVDGSGESAQQLLWLRSGVGDDHPTCPDPLAYRFEDFVEAEMILGGRFFRVVVMDPSGAGELTSTTLPLIVGQDTKYHAADGSGTPRWSFCPNENLYLDAHRLDPAVQEIRLFIIAKPANWIDGMALIDLRTAYPFGQVIPLPGTGATLPAIAWPGAYHHDDVALIVRTSTDGPTSSSPFMAPTDIKPEEPDSIPVGGSTPDEPTDCPSCPDNG